MVVELHDIQGYKQKEIAKIMDWSIGNSKAQAFPRAHETSELLQKVSPWDGERRAPIQVEARAKDICCLIRTNEISLPAFASENLVWGRISTQVAASHSSSIIIPLLSLFSTPSAHHPNADGPVHLYRRFPWNQQYLTGPNSGHYHSSGSVGVPAGVRDGTQNIARFAWWSPMIRGLRCAQFGSYSNSRGSLKLWDCQ